MNLYDTATILGLIISVVIPGLASLLNVGRLPAAASGLITLALSTLTGFLTAWKANPDGYDWKQGALAALGSYIVAAVARRQLWAGTQTDARLLAAGKPGVTA
jgi:uncharacterized membrane protein YfcA